MTHSNLTKRSYCNICSYPSRVCVCHAIKSIESPVKITILQHPGENKHAKNTARLLALGLSNVDIITGESGIDFAPLSDMCKQSPDDFALFYPSNASQALETNLQEIKQNNPQQLIFIDATWRKAYKMWQLNPWLHHLKSWHFTSPPPGRYHIRKTSIKKALSTLEAVAYTLEITQGIDCQALYKLFASMQQNNFSKKP